MLGAPVAGCSKQMPYARCVSGPPYSEKCVVFGPIQHELTEFSVQYMIFMQKDGQLELAEFERNC